ncbi:MAG: methyltransferase domain-containing protein, partial [Arenimonas sp.]
MGLQLMQQFQRQAIPEITRVFGHSGLYLSPSSVFPSELSGNMLAQVLSLHRDLQGFAGTMRCEDENLPIASESLSLVYSLCVLETSPNPDALFEEMVRCMKPEGVMVLLGLNSISPTRLRWHAIG